jgi:hypothetical protein
MLVNDLRDNARVYLLPTEAANVASFDAVDFGGMCMRHLACEKTSCNSYKNMFVARTKSRR